MKVIFLAAFCYSIFLPSIGIAGGLLGDTVSGIGNVIAPGSNVGKPLDDLNKKLKQSAPIYGTIEEGASASVQHLGREFTVESAGPVLANLISISRNDALRGGVSPVPPEVQAVMSRFYGSQVTLGVRFRVGQGGDLALASNAFRFGDAVAITLQDVIVFRDQATAHDLSIWAHELRHVQQYRQWGLQDFAKRYVRDSGAVEKEAYDTQDRFLEWARANNPSGNFGGMPAPQVSTRFMPPTSNICGTPRGMCVLPGFGMLGQGCYCGSAFGPINGQVVPAH